MIDVKPLKTSRDLLAFVENDTKLKRKATTGGGEYAGPCPFCGGRDRFCLQPHHAKGGRWLCRNCTEGKWQDVIAYVMRRDQVNFIEACRRLGAGDMGDSLSCSPVTKVLKPNSNSPPALEWQAKARQVIEICAAALWTAQNKKALDWLHGRGLKDDTLQHWRVGYHQTNGMMAGLHVDRGIIIPCEVGDTIWYLKVRRPTDDPKYKKVVGSKIGLFGAETLGTHEMGVLCEGEFDCMLLHQEAGDLVGVATMGSAADPLQVSTWARYLLPVSRFLIAYDMDGKSERGAEALTALSARMRRIQVPKLQQNDKDLTDYWRSGGNLRDWITFEIERNGYKTTDGDPRKLHQQVLDGITGAIRTHEHHTGCTWAEILVDVQSQNPDLAQRYHNAFEAADDGIYGKWKTGALTKSDWDEFKKRLATWKQATMDLLDYHSLEQK